MDENENTPKTIEKPITDILNEYLMSTKNFIQLVAHLVNELDAINKKI